VAIAVRKPEVEQVPYGVIEIVGHGEHAPTNIALRESAKLITQNPGTTAAVERRADSCLINRVCMQASVDDETASTAANGDDPTMQQWLLIVHFISLSSLR
jgi:hypothetical protein